VLCDGGGLLPTTGSVASSSERSFSSSPQEDAVRSGFHGLLTACARWGEITCLDCKL
jgi:hypothetical protein